MPRLTRAGYRVVTTDLRGLGESSTGWDDYTGAATGSDIVAVLDTLKAGPAHLVGQSNAAGAVVWAAAEAPHLVRSLTLIGPFVRDIPPASFADSAMTWGMITLGLARPWGVSLWGSYYKSLYPSAPPADLDAYTAGLQANLSEKGRLEAVQAMMQAAQGRGHSDSRRSPRFRPRPWARLSPDVRPTATCAMSGLSAELLGLPGCPDRNQ